MAVDGEADVGRPPLRPEESAIGGSEDLGLCDDIFLALVPSRSIFHDTALVVGMERPFSECLLIKKNKPLYIQSISSYLYHLISKLLRISSISYFISNFTLQILLSTV